MTPLTFEALRAANATRHVRYFTDPMTAWGHDDWLIAIGGEVGEALNLCKKMNRVRLGMRGGDSGWEPLVTALGDELADVVIYLDILAGKYAPRLGRESAFAIADFRVLRQCTRQIYNWSEPDMRCLSGAGRGLMKMVGRLADMVPRTLQEGADGCNWVLTQCDCIAYHAGINLGAAVVGKFNATSEKLGFPERLAA